MHIPVFIRGIGLFSAVNGHVFISAALQTGTGYRKLSSSSFIQLTRHILVCWSQSLHSRKHVLAKDTFKQTYKRTQLERSLKSGFYGKASII